MPTLADEISLESLAQTPEEKAMIAGMTPAQRAAAEQRVRALSGQYDQRVSGLADDLGAGIDRRIADTQGQLAALNVPPPVAPGNDVSLAPLATPTAPILSAARPSITDDWPTQVALPGTSPLTITKTGITAAPPRTTVGGAGRVLGAITQAELDDRDARRRRYQDEVDAADRFRNDLYLDKLLTHGINPSKLAPDYGDLLTAEKLGLTRNRLTQDAELSRLREDRLNRTLDLRRELENDRARRGTLTAYELDLYPDLGGTPRAYQVGPDGQLWYKVDRRTGMDAVLNSPLLSGGGIVAPKVNSASYGSEAEARADGKQKGDVVHIKGVGTVKLK